MIFINGRDIKNFHLFELKIQIEDKFSSCSGNENRKIEFAYFLLLLLSLVTESRFWLKNPTAAARQVFYPTQLPSKFFSPTHFLRKFSIFFFTFPDDS